MNRRVIQIFCMVVGMVLASSCGDECPVEQPYSVGYLLMTRTI